MLKKLASVLVLLLLCFSCLLPTAAMATTLQKQNTIILELGNASKDDIDDLRYGQGKLFRKIGTIIEQLQESGEVGDNVQPIVVITKEKKEIDW